MFHLFETLMSFVLTQDRYNSCDDFVDRLNRKYTVILLVIFVTVLNSKQYIGEPLSCFCPAHFTGAHVEYTNNICMISRSFYIAIDKSYLWPSKHQRKQPKGTSSNVPADSSSTPQTFNFRFADRFNFNSHDSQPAAHESQPPLPPYANFTNNLNFIRVENLIAYYPFFLIGQAILFYIPFFFWKNVLNKSAYDLKTLIFIACETQFIDNQFERERSLKYLLSHIERAYDYYNRSRKKPSTTSSSSPPQLDRNFKEYLDQLVDPFKKCTSLDDELTGRKSATTMPVIRPLPPYDEHNNNKVLFRVYLLTKLLYIVNSLGQFLLLSKFVAGQTKSNLTYSDKQEQQLIRNELTYMAENNLLKGIEFGYKSIESLIKSGNLIEDNANSLLIYFHTVVFCDFQIRMLGDRLQRYTIQCVVPINVYSEKMFAIMWFWLLVLNILNVINLLKWLLFYASFRVRFNFVYSNLLNVHSSSSLLLKSETNGYGKKYAKSSLPPGVGSSRFLNEFNRLYKLYFTSGDKCNKDDDGANGFCVQSCTGSGGGASSNGANTTFHTKVQTAHKYAKLDKNSLRSFLVHDRIFVLKMISENTNEIITKELVTLSVEILNKKNFFNHENTV